MDSRDVRGRQLVQHLTEDLGWLEEYARQHPERGRQAGRLRMAAAVVRNCLGPFLEDAASTPLHVVVVGGAGAGKSTITNFLTGTVAAEANPQAGFTRHPIAFTTTNGPLAWSQYVGFLAPLQRIFEESPGDLDRDVYQVRRVVPGDSSSALMEKMIVWDCPDMTTWHAGGYIARLIEVAGLADLVVYVASDERYNDEVPTQFLQLLLQAGRPVITCVVKMPERNAQAIVNHFRTEVVARLPECRRVAACLAVPHLTAEELADPVHKAARYRQPLVDQVRWWADRANDTRRTSVRGGVDFLTRFQDEILSVAKQDLQALEDWRRLVDSGRAEFENRYTKEYLSTEQFPRFNEALVRLLQMLELPGVGQVVSKTLWVVRTPYRLVKGLLNRWSTGAPAASIPEAPVLSAALNGWLDLLRKEANQRAASTQDAPHPLWDHVLEGFQHNLVDQTMQEFDRRLREFQVGLAQDVEATARAIYEELEKKPMALNTLRGSKFALEVTSIGATVVAGGINWLDLILIPAVASLTQELIELLGKQYVDVQREKARERQRELFSRSLALPMAEWLTQWPATGGSTYERLQLALRRIPETIGELAAAVNRRLGEPSE